MKKTHFGLSQDLVDVARSIMEVKKFEKDGTPVVTKKDIDKVDARNKKRAIKLGIKVNEAKDAEKDDDDNADDEDGKDKGKKFNFGKKSKKGKSKDKENNKGKKFGKDQIDMEPSIEDEKGDVSMKEEIITIRRRGVSKKVNRDFWASKDAEAMKKEGWKR